MWFFFPRSEPVRALAPAAALGRLPRPGEQQREDAARHRQGEGAPPLRGDGEITSDHTSITLYKTHTMPNMLRNLWSVFSQKKKKRREEEWVLPMHPLPGTCQVISCSPFRGTRTEQTCTCFLLPPWQIILFFLPPPPPPVGSAINPFGQNKQLLTPESFVSARGGGGRATTVIIEKVAWYSQTWIYVVTFFFQHGQSAFLPRSLHV